MKLHIVSHYFIHEMPQLHTKMIYNPLDTYMKCHVCAYTIYVHEGKEILIGSTSKSVHEVVENYVIIRSFFVRTPCISKQLELTIYFFSKFKQAFNIMAHFNRYFDPHQCKVCRRVLWCMEYQFSG